MKKLFCILFLFLSYDVCATTTPISVNINSISSSSGYYCLDVYVGYDAERGCHIPTAIGFGWINRYLIGIDTNDHAYLQFANSSPQNKKLINTKWICKINLTKSGNITVNINGNKCTYTYS
ncbi:MAG TPA: hypothetical protein VJK30_07250 [Coxiellaceae bacterium]|nr:MAG: hypothetical protein A3E81_08015 [Gammaproteobacteria bacterium RIFCSPHIGHO2_12_FULL_36_30]HLB57104.1 hypothetical protein [Coxiellaceae bacterium]